MSTKSIHVLVIGAAGKMGREVIKAVSGEKELTLVAAIDRHHIGEDIGTIAGAKPLHVPIEGNLEKSLKSRKPDVMVDFTTYDPALHNLELCLKNQVACVVGTTGFSQDNFKTIGSWCKKSDTPAFIAPNFAMGAVLMMKFAQEAAQYFSWSEIIELHHEKKLDAPSGTAIRTAQLMAEARQKFEENLIEETVKGARGGSAHGVRIHSVRLPGFVAHQEVVFGGLGQTLTIRHDSLTRESFMPGVILAVKKVRRLKGLVVGLENLMP